MRRNRSSTPGVPASSVAPTPQVTTTEHNTRPSSVNGFKALARAPGKRREVSVDLAGGIVPVDAEGVHVAAGRLGEGEATRSRMGDVVEVDRLARAGTGYSLDRDVEHPGNGDGTAHAVALDADGLHLHPGEPAHQRTDGGHGPTALSAADGHQRLALLDGGAVVHDHAHRPVARDHRAGGVQQHREAETVESSRAVRAALHVEDEAGVAKALGRPRGQPGRRARADRVTAARLEVVTTDLPLWASHHAPPSAMRGITSSDRLAAPSRDRDEPPPSCPGAAARPRRPAPPILHPGATSPPRP